VNDLDLHLILQSASRTVLTEGLEVLLRKYRVARRG
jgi:hypothetical protein